MTASPERRAGFAWWIVRWRRAVLAASLLIFAALAPSAARVARVLDVSARVDGSESERVDTMLRERFDSPFAQYAVLVATGIPSPDTEAGDRVLRRLVDDVRRVPGVSQTVSYLDAHDPLFRPEGGSGTFVIVGLAADRADADALVPALRAASARLEGALRASAPGVALRWTGNVPLSHDIGRTSETEARGAERRALPLTLTMLLVAFGTLAAALLPLAAALLAITAALGLSAIAAAHWPLSIILQNVVSMLGLGLGIDYALLMVSRFREELAAGHDRESAAVRAMREAGHTILVSAAAVLVGFAALLLVPLSELRAVAVGGALVVGAAALVAVTLLPALLAMLGTRVDAGRLRRAPRRAPRGEAWRRWGRWVAAHPVRVLLASGIPMLLLAGEARRLSSSLPRTGWLPARMESGQALDALAAMHRAGVVHALRVVVALPAGTSALEPRGWSAVARVSERIAADARVDRVQSLPTLAPMARPNLLAISMLPPALRSSFVSADQRAAVVEVMPRSSMDYPSVTRFVRELRARDAVELTGLPGARLHVGGMPAFNADYEDAIAARLPLVIGLVVGGTLLALLVGFRSVLVPIKAIALNLLSVAAALGAVVLVFQDGHGATLLGAQGAMGGLFPALPVLVFCLVFGLSMDYEVFLVARVAEARRAGLGEREALAEGLARTGGVITSAAGIMIVVFAAFTLGDFLMIKVLGFALAVAVLLDATVVRVAVGPALLALAGRWNWWPGERATRSEGASGRAGGWLPGVSEGSP